MGQRVQAGPAPCGVYQTTDFAGLAWGRIERGLTMDLSGARRAAERECQRRGHLVESQTVVRLGNLG